MNHLCCLFRNSVCSGTSQNICSGLVVVPEQYESPVLFVPEHLKTFVPGLLFVSEEYESLVRLFRNI
jgi:hypothetical protein